MIDVGIGLSKNSINSKLHTQVLKYHNRHIEYDFFLTLTRFSTEKSDPMENEKSTSYVFTYVQVGPHYRDQIKEKKRGLKTTTTDQLSMQSGRLLLLTLKAKDIHKDVLVCFLKDAFKHFPKENANFHENSQP